MGAFTSKGQLLVYSVPRLEHMYTVPVTISSPRYVRRWLGLLLAHRPVVVGRLASMRAETTLIGRSRTTSFTGGSSVHYLDYAGKRCIMARFSTSFETRKSFLPNRSPCRWGQQLCWAKCTRTSVDRVPQGHKLIFFVSMTTRNC